MKRTKKQRIILLVTLALVAATSCTKERQSNNFTWNAIAFTESEDPEFSSFMDQPYVNITYPSAVEEDAISYVDGKWSLTGFNYTFSAHNWGEESITLSLIKDGELLVSSEITPQPSTPTRGYKQFSFSHKTPPGKYTIEISLNDHRGVTRLNRHILHSGQDYFEMK